MRANIVVQGIRSNTDETASFIHQMIDKAISAKVHVAVSLTPERDDSPDMPFDDDRPRTLKLGPRNKAI